MQDYQTCPSLLAKLCKLSCKMELVRRHSWTRELERVTRLRGIRQRVRWRCVPAWLKWHEIGGNTVCETCAQCAKMLREIGRAVVCVPEVGVASCRIFDEVVTCKSQQLTRHSENCAAVQTCLSLPWQTSEHFRIVAEPEPARRVRVRGVAAAFIVDDHRMNATMVEQV